MENHTNIISKTKTHHISSVDSLLNFCSVRSVVKLSLIIVSNVIRHRTLLRQESYFYFLTVKPTNFLRRKWKVVSKNTETRKLTRVYYYTNKIFIKKKFLLCVYIKNPDTTSVVWLEISPFFSLDNFRTVHNLNDDYKVLLEGDYKNLTLIT